ncbi:hypothetical protein [Kordia sp.]|uniref:hypothetical protein n=1 Tax=Kordia sp. TaxID=1965332 RepID=UPI003D287D4C
MKKVQYIFTLLICITTLMISCQKNKEIPTSDDIGTHAFYLLNNFENTSEKEYINSMYTYEELKSYVQKNADSLENDFKENIAVLTKENFNSRIKKDYKNLKETATSFNIDWNDIEAINFQYWPRAKYGIESLKGDLFFTHDTKNYKVTVTSLKVGNSYFITKIEALKEVIPEQ